MLSSVLRGDGRRVNVRSCEPSLAARNPGHAQDLLAKSQSTTGDWRIAQCGSGLLASPDPKKYPIGYIHRGLTVDFRRIHYRCEFEWPQFNAWIELGAEREGLL